MRLHECDVCGAKYNHAAPTVDFDPDARFFGGDLCYRDGDTVEWPIAESYLDVCPECCAAIAEVLRERMGGH